MRSARLAPLWLSMLLAASASRADEAPPPPGDPSTPAQDAPAADTPAPVEDAPTEPTSADPPSEDPAVQAARDQARRIALEGDAAFGTGRCDNAIELWRRADAIFHAPTIQLRVARCQALLGRVVAATETYEAIVGEAIGPDAPAPFVEAQARARQELTGVRARVGTLRFELAGERGARAAVTVDAVRVGAVERLPVDPGKHLVVVRAGTAKWERWVEVEEGQETVVGARLTEVPPPPPDHTQRAVGLVMGGVGVAALVVGSFFGLSATGLSSDLEEQCGDDRTSCPRSQEDAIADLKAHALVSDVLLICGGALTLGGAALVLTEPGPSGEGPTIRIVPTVAGVVGRVEL